MITSCVCELSQRRAGQLHSVATFLPNWTVKCSVWLWAEPHSGLFDWIGSVTRGRRSDTFLLFCVVASWRGPPYDSGDVELRNVAPVSGPVLDRGTGPSRIRQEQSFSTCLYVYISCKYWVYVFSRESTLQQTARTLRLSCWNRRGLSFIHHHTMSASSSSAARSLIDAVHPPFIQNMDSYKSNMHDAYINRPRSSGVSTFWRVSSDKSVFTGWMLNTGTFQSRVSLCDTSTLKPSVNLKREI